ncbi:RNA-binding protein [Hansschlegelia quercus]|uniref:RNA-binding protein n=1 Tax=Hansschlegelia quercus TaxID=2528245 RepID=A0A4Q9GHS1_9HYPH|nr:RNA-binding protein [Hansschlegelia quercus]TBN53739.1 RNA-binding protein [Hansschlegelia quercus]
MAAKDDDRNAPERTCVATRAVRPAEELIRFVRAPDGQVVPDLKRELPGRGAWVTATADAVRLAVTRKAFARGLKDAVMVDPAIDQTVDELLERQTLAMLGFANKAGRVVCGFAKVEAALMKEPVLALIEAADAGADGVRKLAQAWRRAGKTGETRRVGLFRSAQLDLALGRSNVVHAALLAGPVSAAFLARCEALARYRGMNDGPEPAEAAGSTAASGEEPAKMDRA